MATNLLSLENIYCGYGQNDVLKAVSVHIQSGEIVSLLGANGAGKSTLINCIFANPKVRQGAIKLHGNTIHHLEQHRIIQTGIAIVPEGRRLFPQMTVEENILLGGLKIPPKTLHKNIENVYSLFPKLKERRWQSAGTLSGGEQQMCAIARALIRDPDIILLDEPSLGLAPILVKKIFAILAEINQQGTTLFLVEQNANMALKIAHRGYVLTNGKVTLTGTGEELLNNPAVQSAYLGGMHR